MNTTRSLFLLALSLSILYSCTQQSENAQINEVKNNNAIVDITNDSITADFKSVKKTDKRNPFYIAYEDTINLPIKFTSVRTSVSNDTIITFSDSTPIYHLCDTSSKIKLKIRFNEKLIAKESIRLNCKNCFTGFRDWYLIEYNSTLGYVKALDVVNGSEKRFIMPNILVNRTFDYDHQINNYCCYGLVLKTFSDSEPHKSIDSILTQKGRENDFKEIPNVPTSFQGAFIHTKHHEIAQTNTLFRIDSLYKIDSITSSYSEGELGYFERNICYLPITTNGITIHQDLKEISSNGLDNWHRIFPMPEDLKHLEKQIIVLQKSTIMDVPTDSSEYEPEYGIYYYSKPISFYEKPKYFLCTENSIKEVFSKDTCAGTYPTGDSLSLQVLMNTKDKELQKWLQTKKQPCY